MSDEPKHRVTILYGMVESDERHINRDGWLQHQSRRVMRNTAGEITEQGEWEDCGGRMRISQEAMQPLRSPWWELWRRK